MKQRQTGRRFLFYCYVPRKVKNVIEHQPGVQTFVNGRPVRRLLKVGDKLPQAERRLMKGFSMTDTPPRLFIEPTFLPLESGTRDDRRGNPVTHVLKGDRLPWRALFVRENPAFPAGFAFDLVPLEADVADGIQNLNPVDLPIKFQRLGVNRGQNTPCGGRRGERVRQTFHFGFRHRETGKVTPRLYDDFIKLDFAQSIHLHDLFPPAVAGDLQNNE